MIDAARNVGDESETAVLVALVQDPSVAGPFRLAAGARLAALGDPRPGVLTLAPEWCVVDGGPFLMGADTTSDPAGLDREHPRHLVVLPTFDIARYPVTNRQWRRFVEGGGYDECRWWSRVGWATRQAAGWRSPRTWLDTGWSGNQANRPVTGVSWYEAHAYATWLSAMVGDRIDVCSEAEWEKAARGCDGRIYPFGNRLDAEALHVCAASPHWREAPAPVGCYPQGASPWGAEDMVGNTYSWTSSRWGASEPTPSYAYPYQRQDGRESPESDDYRVVRGGAWGFPVGNARCSYRGKDRPDDAFNNLGVRLVRRRNPDPAQSPVAGKERPS